ncbi:SPOR domain-containing protein [Geofilum sp. OHC36d9]|uniref:SPOR domain-containing protein n=1 Tax=Geofilum sp. OHC36d9 TaxID=3458413 RepID=UPI004033A2FF
MKNVLLFALVLAIGLVACNKKKKADPTPEPVPVQEVIEPVKPDTIFEEAVPEVVETVVQEPVKPNKYFLIGGSFVEYANAEKYRQEMLNQGFASEIIERPEGPNGEFYKVSYMGFSSWNKALEVLNSERTSVGRDSVWLLVRR